MPASRRPAVEALWLLDATLGNVLATGREPMVSRIRLAWWREALERLDREPPPPEPLLQALATHILPSGVSGAELAAMEEGWAGLLEPGPLGEEALAGYGCARGGLLFRYSARLLGEGAGPEQAGICWALVDLARRSGNPADRKAAIEAASKIETGLASVRSLRPLTMLAILARRDIGRGAESFEQQGSPGRMLRMIAHRLWGR